MKTGFVGACAVALLCLAAACSKPAETTAPASDTATTDTAPAGDVGIPAGETGGACGGAEMKACINAADYCMAATGMCSADAPGTCTTKPTVCTEDEMPVCGCDGVTYGNACKASMAGVSVASDGACTTG